MWFKDIYVLSYKQREQNINLPKLSSVLTFVCDVNPLLGSLSYENALWKTNQILSVMMKSVQRIS